jgi:FkbM family methyltransferase
MLAPLHNIGHFLAHHPLTRKRRIAALGRYLQWQVKSRLRDEMIVEWIAGTRLAVRNGMTGATGNIYAGLHEFYDMAFAIHFLRAEDVFADVGANIGSYTILASGVAGARTIAFEPDPGTAARLEKNIQLNGLSERVELHIAALGESAGWIRFSIGRDTENHVVASDEPEGREVPVETLDAAVGDRVPSFIKIDVEGYEAQVLRGALRLLEQPKLKAVLTENKSEPVVNMLEAAGFREVAYDAFQRKLVPASEITMGNALFVRDATFVEHRVATAKSVSVLGQLI